MDNSIKTDDLYHHFRKPPYGMMILETIGLSGTPTSDSLICKTLQDVISYSSVISACDKGEAWMQSDERNSLDGS